jgi:hypothetical protein
MGLADSGIVLPMKYWEIVAASGLPQGVSMALLQYSYPLRLAVDRGRASRRSRLPWQKSQLAVRTFRLFVDGML